MKTFKRQYYLKALWLVVLTLCSGWVYGQERRKVGGFSFRIVQISDTQPRLEEESDWQEASECIDLVNQLNPDLVIFPGDITDLGTEKEYQRMKNLVSQIEAPMYLVPGNHDTRYPGEAFEKEMDSQQLRARRLGLYHQYFGPDHWSFEYHGFLFVGFDSTENWPELSAETRAWLMDVLQSSSAPYKFVVMHYTQGMVRSSPLEGLFIRGEVTGILHGHNHKVQAYRDDKTGRLVFSSGRAARRSDYGVMYYDVYGDTLVCFWQPVHGDTRPLGVFPLNEIQQVVRQRKEILDSVPDVAQVGPTEVTLQWWCRSTPSSQIRFRQQGQKKWKQKESHADAIRYEVSLSELEPDTEYEAYVRVETKEFGLVKSDPVKFRTVATKP